MCIVYGLYNVNIHLPPFLGLPLSNKKSSANIHIMLKAILKAFNSIFFLLTLFIGIFYVNKNILLLQKIMITKLDEIVSKLAFLYSGFFFQFSKLW